MGFSFSGVPGPLPLQSRRAQTALLGAKQALWREMCLDSVSILFINLKMIMRNSMGFQ